MQEWQQELPIEKYINMTVVRPSCFSTSPSGSVLLRYCTLALSPSISLYVPLPIYTITHKKQEPSLELKPVTTATNKVHLSLLGK